MSTCTAVRPVMPTVVPVASSISEVADRSACVVRMVRGSVGEESGVIMIFAAVPSSLAPTSCACLTPPTRSSWDAA